MLIDGGKAFRFFAEFSQRLFDFIDNIAFRYLPHPFGSPLIAPVAARPPPQPTLASAFSAAINRPRPASSQPPDNPLSAEQPPGGEPARVLNLHEWEHVVPLPREDDWLACLPPLGVTSEDRGRAAVVCAGEYGITPRVLRIRRMCGAQAEACVCHFCHSSTCAKGGRKGDDLDCRMGIPLPLLSVSAGHLYDPKLGLISLGMGSNRLVPYCPALMMGWVRS